MEFKARKGQKSLEMIIGLVILLVVAGVVISTFLSQFEGAGDQYKDTLKKKDITNQCQSACANYKSSTGINAQTSAIEYCTKTFAYDSDGDGTVKETAGRLYNSYCEDGVKCFNLHECNVGQDVLDAARCKEIMVNYYTSGKIGMSEGEAKQEIAEWYQPNGEEDKTIGTCDLEGLEHKTWYSQHFENLG